MSEASPRQLTFFFLDQCRLGLAFIKPTQWLTNAPEAEQLQELRCSHPRGTHSPMTGRQADGKFVTAAQSAYPSELCQVFATCYVVGLLELVRTLDSRDQQDEGLDASDAH